MKDIKIKKKYIIIMVITLIVGVGAVTLAYFQGNVINDLINGTTVSTGNIDVKISDTEVNVSNVNPIYNGSVNYEDATFKKTFTVTNSGTLNTCTDLYLKINSIADSLKSTDFRYMVIHDETGTTLEGNFSTASNGNDLKLGSLYFFEGETSKKYTMYIWIEYQESQDQMTMLNKSMNATLFVKGKDVKTKDACDNRDTFRITYVLNGGTGKTSESVSKGNSVTLYTPTITDTNLTFGGWYSDSELTNEVTTFSNLSDDVKLYAMWTCTYDGELKQSSTTTIGEYKYTYSSTSGWRASYEGESSTPMNFCTFINKTPVVSLIGAFEKNKKELIDLSNLNTHYITNMSKMFSHISATTIVLKNFDTSNVTNMGDMFYKSQATTLDVSSFDTRNVTDMSRMFYGSQLTTLDLSSFNTSKVTNMSNMFNSMSSLKTIYVSEKFVTTNVTSGNNMFISSKNLVGGAGTVYDENNIDKTYARIDGGTALPGYFTLKSN